MKKVFRFKYSSLSDYIWKSTAIFFYIPYINVHYINTPLDYYLFETQFKIEEYFTFLLAFLANNKLSRFSDFAIIIELERPIFQLAFQILDYNIFEKLNIPIDLTNFAVIKL